MEEINATAIPQRQKCISIEHPYIGGAKDIIDDVKGKSQEDVNKDVDDEFAFHQSQINALDSQNYVTVDTFAALPATGSADTIYRVCNWDGAYNSGEGQVDSTKYTEYAWASTEYRLLSIKSGMEEVFDVSQYNATGGSYATYDSLSDLLTNHVADIPVARRKGGMSVKFVQSSDHKYVQYFFVGATISGFGTTTNWIGIDDSITDGSNSVATSGNVAKYVLPHFVYRSDINSVFSELYITGLNSTQTYKFTIVRYNGSEFVITIKDSDNNTVFTSTITNPVSGVINTLTYANNNVIVYTILSGNQSAYSSDNGLTIKEDAYSLKFNSRIGTYLLNTDYTKNLSIEKSLKTDIPMVMTGSESGKYIDNNGNIASLSVFTLEKYDVQGGEEVKIINTANPNSTARSYAVYSSNTVLSTETLLLRGPQIKNGPIERVITLSSQARCVVVSHYTGSDAAVYNVEFNRDIANDVYALERSLEKEIENTIKNEDIAYSYDGSILCIACNNKKGVEMCYRFNKCLANNLFTFSNVGYRNVTRKYPSVENLRTMSDVTILNSATSDNIGPIRMGSGYWIGGNHTKTVDGQEIKTAKTLSYSILVNGMELVAGDEGYAKEVLINVHNEFYDPTSTTIVDGSLVDKMCDVYEFYKVKRNTIDVSVMIQFITTTDSVNYYYGMQSMFRNDVSIITPLGQYYNWTTFANGMNFTKGDYPNFNRYIEKSADGYQSTHLLSLWMGDHSLLDGADNILTTNSGKVYHHLMEDYQNISGGVFQWQGLYSFAKNVIYDNSGVLVYSGQIEGKNAIYISTSSNYSGVIALPSELLQKKYKVYEAYNVTAISVNDSVFIGSYGLQLTANSNSSLILVED